MLVLVNPEDIGERAHCEGHEPHVERLQAIGWLPLSDLDTETLQAMAADLGIQASGVEPKDLPAHMAANALPDLTTLKVTELREIAELAGYAIEGSPKKAELAEGLRQHIDEVGWTWAEKASQSARSALLAQAGPDAGLAAAVEEHLLAGEG